MKLKTIGLLFLAMNMIVGCAGEKNDTQVDDSVIFAVRTLENANDLPESERQQVALLTGDISTPEKAQAAAANAEWMPIGDLQQDDELALATADSTQEIGKRRRGHRQARRHNRHKRRHRHWRPYHRHTHNWWSYTWVTPSYNYWGTCGHSGYIYYGGRCVVPYSSYYGSYYWSARYYYYSPVVYRSHRHRHHWRGRAHIRFYW